MDDLLSANLISELGVMNTSDRGRPRKIFGPNTNSRVVISIYIEHFRLCGGVVNLEEQIIAEQEVCVPQNSSGEDFVGLFVGLVQSLQSMVPSDSTILGVAFSPVGAVDRQMKRWISCNRWPQLQDVEFEVLEGTLGLPIFIRRNLETVLDYEIQTNHEYLSSNVVLFHWGYGIGYSYSYKGAVVETERGNYSGVGHMVINPNSEKRCQCGARGCLEAEAAIWALLPQFHTLQPGPDDGYYKQLSKAILGDEPFLKEAVSAVQVGLYNVCKMFSPDYLLFLSPFSSNRDLVALLKNSAESSFPDPVHYQPTFRVIGKNFRASVYANAYPLFRREIRKLIAEA